MSEAAAFWDASALTPLFVREAATDRVRDKARKLLPVVWWATRVEVRSAITRVHRLGTLSDAARRIVIGQLMMAAASWQEIAPSEELRGLAVDLLDQYPLRTGDSLQLAAALVWCREKPAGRQFICQDFRLCDAASQAGFTVIQL